MTRMKKIRYLKQANLLSEQVLQKNYLRELIEQYGVDIQYFRLKLDFYAGDTTDPNTGVVTKGNQMGDWIFGSAPSAGYHNYKDMVVFMNVDNENTLLSNLGIETNITSEIFIVKQEFNETWRDEIGLMLESVVNIGNFEYNQLTEKLVGYGRTPDNDLRVQCELTPTLPLPEGFLDPKNDSYPIDMTHTLISADVVDVGLTRDPTMYNKSIYKSRTHITCCY